MPRFVPQSIARTQSDLAAGKSSVSLVEECLQRIAESNNRLRAMIFVGKEEALDSARRIDAEIRSGKQRGRLHGVPIAVKDVIDVRGWPTTAGSRLHGDYIAKADASCVANLREAGAIIIGKTNLHELTAGGHDNPWFGKVVNPLNPARGTGGTSSGSAAAVAAGYCVAAVGTDTGGSNRSPAAATGLVGFKPASGMIDKFGVRPTAPTFDAIGPIASTVEDAWIVYSAMRGRPNSSLQSRDLSGLRIGLCPDIYAAEVDPVVANAQETWLRLASNAGASIHTFRFPSAEKVKEAGKTILTYEFASEYGLVIEKHPDRVGEAVRKFASDGLAIGEEAYKSALAFRAKAMAKFESLMSSIDVLAMPVAPGLAPRLSDEMTKVGSNFVPYGMAGGGFRRWANFFNVASIAIPLSAEVELPVSIQIAAVSNREEELFLACNALSQLG
jgi:aspartyl-tRNA(Asn)/glutamyl-tRNA(Gln) amidotransferase subunit A